MKLHRFMFLLPFMLLFFFAGCATTDHAEKKESVALAAPVVEPPAFVFHRVMAGETMATIARWYSGRDSNWRELAEHNPDLSPWRLRAGDYVKVPISMTTVHKEQPNYSTAPRKAKKKASSKVVEEDLPPGPEEVFGPK